MNIFKHSYLLLLAAGLFATACTDEDYKVYDTSQKDAVFFNYLNASGVNDSIIDYAFNYDIATEHVVSLPISLMGMPGRTARTVDLEPVADSTDMVSGTHYTVDPVVLEAGLHHHHGTRTPAPQQRPDDTAAQVQAPPAHHRERRPASRGPARLHHHLLRHPPYAAPRLVGNV